MVKGFDEASRGCKRREDTCNERGGQSRPGRNEWMFCQRTKEKGSDDGVKESGVLTVVRTKKREERKGCGGRSINKVSTLTPSTLISAISIMIFSDRPSEAELIHTVEICAMQPCSIPLTPAAPSLFGSAWRLCKTGAAQSSSWLDLSPRPSQRELSL